MLKPLAPYFPNITRRMQDLFWLEGFKELKHINPPKPPINRCKICNKNFKKDYWTVIFEDVQFRVNGSCFYHGISQYKANKYQRRNWYTHITLSKKTKCISFFCDINGKVHTAPPLPYKSLISKKSKFFFKKYKPRNESVNYLCFKCEVPTKKRILIKPHPGFFTICDKCSKKSYIPYESLLYYFVDHLKWFRNREIAKWELVCCNTRNESTIYVIPVELIKYIIEFL